VKGWQDENGDVQGGSKIEWKDKLLVPKFDFLIEHSSLGNCNVARNGRDADPYYVNPNNAHVKNEILY
jgi:hypothetical protein